MKKRILYILKHDPWGIGGGSYVCLMYLTAFRKLFSEYEFDVCICQECINHQPESWVGKCNFIPVPPRGKISRLSSIFTGIMHRHQKKALHLIKTNEYDYCIFDHNNIAGTLYAYLKSNTQSIVIHHNYEPKYYKDNTTSWIYRFLFMHHVKSTERKAYLNCSYNIFLTKEDETFFRKIYGTPLGRSATIGIFDINKYNFTLTAHAINPKNVIVITGSLNNVQNEDGILYFMKELYPLIANRCEIIIAGKNPTKAIQNATKGFKNIQLISNPKDINEIILRGNIFVCPTRLGGGIKVRISDGLRNGLPVIAQSVSSRGYNDYVSKGYFYPYETPTDFLNQFNKLENNRLNKKISIEKIADFYQSNNSISFGIEKLRQLLEI